MRIDINREILFRTLSLIYHSSPKWTFWRSVIILLEGMIPLANIYLLKLVVDAIVIAIEQNQIDESLNSIMLVIFGWAFVNVLSSIIRTCSLYINTAQQQLLSDYLQNKIHTKSSTIDYQFFEDHEYYDNFHRANKESVNRCNQLITNISQVARTLVSLIGLTIVLFTLHWMVLVILTLTVIPVAIIRFIYANKLHSWRKVRTAANRKAGNFSQILTGDAYAKELRLFGLAQGFIQSFRSLRNDLFKEKLSLDYVKAKREIFSGLAEALALIGVAYFIIDKGISGAITVGSIVMYFQAFQRGQQFLRSSIQGSLNVYESRLFLEHLYDFLDLKLILPESTDPKKIPAIRSLSFEGLSFKYPFGRGEVLKNVNLKIESSQVLAIVGRNGSGKSTLAKLLCRLYDPTNGSIKINGTDIRSFKTDEWRKQISPLFQDYGKYNLSLESNITGSRTASDKGGIVESLEKAGALEVYEELGQDLSVTLGKIFKKSKELSEGQWQRIALSRTLYKDAPIMILDEPTSHMDGDSENKFLENIKKMRENRIIILITHRLTNITLADQVVILDKGEIVDSGNHDELYHRSELYKSLFHLDDEKEPC